MPFVDAKDETQLFYKDWGHGRPVVLIHGWPLDADMWEYQMPALAEAGYRTIAYDRRGFGRSDQPWGDYDYDTFADDLKAVLDTLDLQNVTLVGMSMGGGEIARYMSRHGGARVSKVVFISAITPYLLKTDDNPDGVDADVFEDMKEKLNKDRADFLQTFGKQFYGIGFLDKPVSQAQLDGDFARAYAASQKATVDCVTAFSETDFRDDLAQIHVPTLIIHGDADKVVPIEASAERTAAALPNAEYIVYEGGSHGLVVSEKDRVIEDLLSFIQEGVSVREPIGTTTLY